MTDLVACLSTGKGTWSPVIKLINSGDFENVYLVTNEFGKDNFQGPESVDMIVLDRDMSIEDMRDEIKDSLKDKVSMTDVALNLTSGSGKEHMALLSAMLKLGVGIRMVVASEDGFEEV